MVWVLPSPKSHVQRAIKPDAVLLISVKLTASPWQVGCGIPEIGIGKGRDDYRL